MSKPKPPAKKSSLATVAALGGPALALVASGAVPAPPDVRARCERRLGVLMAETAVSEGQRGPAFWSTACEIVEALDAGLSRDEVAFCLDLTRQLVDACERAVRYRDRALSAGLSPPVVPHE